MASVTSEQSFSLAHWMLFLFVFQLLELTQQRSCWCVRQLPYTTGTWKHVERDAFPLWFRVSFWQVLVCLGTTSNWGSVISAHTCLSSFPFLPYWNPLSGKIPIYYFFLSYLLLGLLLKILCISLATCSVTNLLMEFTVSNHGFFLFRIRLKNTPLLL